MAAAADAKSDSVYMGYYIFPMAMEIKKCPLKCEKDPCDHQLSMTHGQRVTIPVRCTSGHRVQYECTILVSSPQRLLDANLGIEICAAVIKCSPLCAAEMEAGAESDLSVICDGGPVYGPKATTSFGTLAKMHGTPLPPPPSEHDMSPCG